MNYGEQRFREYSRELSPEQKARQTLLIEAIKEQAAYERQQRKEVIKKVKYTTKYIYRVVVIGLLLCLIATLTRCDKQETLTGCTTIDLGVAPENPTPLSLGRGSGKGYCGTIYVEGGRIKEDICPCN